MFDYEKTLYNKLTKPSTRKNTKRNKHLWVKKATGLGVTEFMLRFMSWLCYFSDKYSGGQMCIVTGPNRDLAKGLIARIKLICESVEKIKTKDTVAILNDCKIEAYPSHHLDAMRSLEKPGFILLDEADFFPPREQRNARDVAERYIAKSDPYIVMISTPNLPGGLFEAIEKEPDQDCIYNKVMLDYKVGVGKIYTKKEISMAQASPSFEREYNLKYGYGIGNIFPYQLLDACIEDYDLALDGGEKVLAIDPAFGSSMFAIVGIEQLDNILYVKEAKEFERASPSAMLELVSEMAKGYGTVLVDSAHPGLVRDLQEKGIDAEPVVFKSQLQSLTSQAAKAVYERRVRIHTAFTELSYQLRAVRSDAKGNPDKRSLKFDLGDAFLMGVSRFNHAPLMSADLGAASN
jgi:hypothetical protein